MPTFYGAIDLSKNELRNAVIQNLGSAPSSPAKGQMYMDTSSNTLYYWDGTTWQALKSGTGGPPTGAASGDLTGTYPGPTVKGLNGTALSGLATGLLKNTTGTGVPSIAAAADIPTVAAGATGALSATDPSVTNARTPSGVITGDLAGSTWPNLQIAAGAIVVADTATAFDLGALASAHPTTTDVAMNSHKITGLLDPVSNTDAVTKLYVDNAVQGLDAKASVKCATTATLAGFIPAPSSVDGITISAGDRVLVKNQTAPQDNGIYFVSGGNLVRTSDMTGWSQVPSAYTWVEQGTVNADTGWLCTADTGGTIGTTPMPWVQFSGAGQINAGNGLTKTGNTIDFATGDTSLTVAADSVVVNTAVIATVAALNSAVTGMAKKFTKTLTGTAPYATGEVVNHALGSKDVQVTVISGVSPFPAIEVDWEATDTANVLLRFNPALPASSRVVVVG